MANNQEWFNKKFSKDVDKIEIDCEDFEDSLVIEDYANLKEINISDSEKIRKLTLKNLVNLKKCTVKGCEIEQIIIENCPDVESLNVYNNSLTNLEFIKNLSNLSILEIGKNEKIFSGVEHLPENLKEFSYKKTGLAKILEVYNNDWKKYKQYLKEQGISEEESNRKELLSLREENKNLDKKYKKLKANVNDLVSLIGEKLNLLSNKIPSNDPATKEIISNLRESINNITDENKKLKDELEQFRPLFSEEAPIIEASRLGSGAFGEVYKGVWKTQFAAVKKTFANTTDETELAKIRKELKILKNLRSSYTIQYYGEYQKDNDIYLIMEYAEHGSLTKFITDNKDKDHDWQLNYSFIKQMVKGLSYLHNEGVLHRDLKSHNILITEGYIAKLADFGLAKLLNSSNYSSSSKEIKGTVRWLAPELLRGEKHSEQSDIYSLGMVIWEVSAKCTVPFKDVDYNLLGHYIMSGKKETIPNGTPENVRNIVQQCWKDILDERITLANILEIIESDESNSQITYTSHLSEFKSILSSQNEQSKSSQQKNISQPAEFPMTELQEALEKGDEREESCTDERIGIWCSEETDINKEKAETPKFVLQVEQPSK